MITASAHSARLHHRIQGVRVRRARAREAQRKAPSFRPCNFLLLYFLLLYFLLLYFLLLYFLLLYFLLLYFLLLYFLLLYFLIAPPPLTFITSEVFFCFHIFICTFTARRASSDSVRACVDLHVIRRVCYFNHEITKQFSGFRLGICA
jgi:hypothetical protein